MRELTQVESEFLHWVLPEDRPGYAEVLQVIRNRNVVAQGRRGEGHLILADPGTVVDHESPLPQVLAYGQVAYDEGECIVTVREPLGEQLDVEIAGVCRGHEKHRWTYSRWSPGDPCPQCGGGVRLVSAQTRGGQSVHVALCGLDKRVWVHESRTGVNHPIPMTLYYSELMRQTGTKDPTIALDASRLFTHLRTYTDSELLRAFVSYNDIRTKVPVGDRIIVPERPTGLFVRFMSLFRRTS